MMVTVIDVFMRYLFNRPIRASLDTVEVMLLVFVFNGMAAAFFGRRNIVIDLLDSVFGARMTGVLIRIADILSVLCLGLLAWAMLLPARRRISTATRRWSCPFPSTCSGSSRWPASPGRFSARWSRWWRSRPGPNPGAPNEPVADRRGRRRRPVRAAAAARAGVDFAGAGRLLRQCPGERLGRAPSRWPGPRRSTSPRPTRSRSCRCSS